MRETFRHKLATHLSEKTPLSYSEALDAINKYEEVKKSEENTRTHHPTGGTGIARTPDELRRKGAL